MNNAPRRELTVAVLACAVAAGVALYAASRPWVTEVTVRPAPLPPLSRGRAGGSVVPPLPALAWVSLAGAGALLATRGRARQMLAVGLLGCAAGIVASAAYALAAVDRITAAGPAFALVAGVGLGVIGIVTLRRGGAWSGLGTRYEPPSSAGPRPAAPEQPSPGPARSDPDLWDAIDRGEDPTKT